MGNASTHKQDCVPIKLYLLCQDAEIGRVFIILFFNWTPSMSQYIDKSSRAGLSMQCEVSHPEGLEIICK